MTIGKGSQSEYDMFSKFTLRFSGWDTGKSNPKKQENTLSQTLSDKLTLQILGTLLCEKNAIKEGLIKKLVGFGFSI